MRELQGIQVNEGSLWAHNVLEDLKIQATYSKNIKIPNLNINIIEKDKKDNPHQYYISLELKESLAIP